MTFHMWSQRVVQGYEDVHSCAEPVPLLIALQKVLHKPGPGAPVLRF